MSAVPQVPRTESEIAAAKDYLRQEFSHAIGHFDSYLRTEEFAQGKNLAVKARHITNEQYDGEIAGLRKAIEQAVAEVGAGSEEGEKILNRFIDLWQIEGHLPKCFVD
jgi:hypothetical protein